VENILAVFDKVIFFPSEELTLTIRIYDRVSWEYGSGGKFSFIVFARILLQLHRFSVVSRVKGCFCISNVSTGVCGQHVAHELQVWWACCTVSSVSVALTAEVHSANMMVGIEEATKVGWHS
jgi:hypothetical protein